jgi:putative ABC transport system substrate-binding protein
VKRREFIAGLAGAAAWPVLGHAQQPMPVIGFLRRSPLAESAHLTTAFRHGLKEAGFVDGHNIAIEYRSAENVEGRLPTLVGNLLRVPVAVIIGESLSAFVGKVARATTPFVFATGETRSGTALSPARIGLGGTLQAWSFSMRC